MKIFTLGLLIFFLSFGVSAEVSSFGELALESRVFKDDNNSDTQDWGLGAYSQLEVNYQSGAYSHVFRGTARVDRKDQGRNFVTFEDAYLSARIGGGIKLLAGYKIFNWSATEAFHSADQLNSRNYDGELENLEKKGELTVEAEFPVHRGTFSLYYFPRFEDPQLPSSRSRIGGAGIDLGGPSVVDGMDANSNERWVDQFGLRTVQYLDWGDLSAYALKHVNRNYPLIGTHQYGDQDLGFPFGSVFLPFDETPTTYYLPGWQYGATAQILTDSGVLKFEGAYYKFDEHKPIFDLALYDKNSQAAKEDLLQERDEHGEVVIGYEHQLFHDNGTQSTLLFEAVTLLGLNKEERAATSIFQRDVFLGYRFAFNDTMGKELLFSMIADIERSQEFLYNLSYTQRLSNSWKIETSFRVYDAAQKGEFPQGLETLDEASGINLTLTRFF